MKPALVFIITVLLAGCSSVPGDTPSTTLPPVGAAVESYGPLPHDYEEQIMAASCERWAWAAERALSASKPRRAQLKGVFAATEYCYAVKFGLYKRGQDVSNEKFRKFMAIFEGGRLVRIERASDTWLTLSWVDQE